MSPRRIWQPSWKDSTAPAVTLAAGVRLILIVAAAQNSPTTCTNDYIEWGCTGLVLKLV